MVRDQVVGVLDFQSDQVNFFDSSMIDLLTLFSTQASLALENARLYSSERRRSQQLEAINAIARQTTAVLELDDLLAVVCRVLLEWFPAIDHIAALLVENDALRIRAFEGKLTPNVAKGSQLAPGAGLASKALTLGHSIMENDVNEVKGYIAGFAETQSEMCVPLIYLGEKLGILALDSARKGAFDIEDVDRKSTRLNSSHQIISYAVFCLKKKKKLNPTHTHSQTHTQCSNT